VGGEAPTRDRTMSVDPLIGPVTSPALHVMTFNIRRRSRSLALRRVDRWALRRQAVADLVGAEAPSLLGVQEAMPDQAATVRDALGRGYRFVGRGHGRSQRGEGAPIFFDGERLELLDWHQAALSDEPGVPGSMSWGNHVPRIVVTAVFRDRTTGTRFLALNTHLDHLSSPSRVRSAEVIREQVAGQSLPTIVTGDFNAGTKSPAYRALFEGEALQDAWVAAAHRPTPESGTFGGFQAPRPTGRRIDWIAVSPDVQVDSAAINARMVDGRWPSDHVPVQAVVRLPPS
jgi:endonuclease/exonuclease/phosphatase family metal-dependent hydrolase